MTTEIIRRWLGTKPFVLIELDGNAGSNFDNDPDDYTMTMDMTFGGGIGGANGALGVLAEMLEQQGWETTPPEGFDPDA